MPSALCVASWAATRRSSASKAMRSGRRRNSAAPITRRRPRSGARIARCPPGTANSPPSPSSSGSAARAAGASVKTGRTPRSTSASALPGRTSHSSAPTASSSVGLLRLQAPARTPSSVSRSCADRSVRRSRSTQRAGGPLVADRQRVAQIDEDRVRERRHGRPAQPHDDLVEVDAAGDPPGRGAHEAQPVAVPPHGRGPARRQALSRTALLAAGGLRTGPPRRPAGPGCRSGTGRGRCVVRFRGRGLGVLGAGAVPGSCRCPCCCRVPFGVVLLPGRGGRPRRRCHRRGPGPVKRLRRAGGRGRRGTQERPAGVRGGGARLWAFEGGGVLRHACRIRPSGAARRGRAVGPAEIPIPGIRVPRNGIPAWSEACSCVSGEPSAARSPVPPSYPTLTSCRPSVTIGQAQCLLRELRAPPVTRHRPSTTLPRTAPGSCGGRSYGCRPGAHQGSHEDKCAGVRSQSSGRTAQPRTDRAPVLPAVRERRAPGADHLHRGPPRLPDLLGEFGAPSARPAGPARTRPRPASANCGPGARRCPGSDPRSPPRRPNGASGSSRFTYQFLNRQPGSQNSHTDHGSPGRASFSTPVPNQRSRCTVRGLV